MLDTNMLIKRNGIAHCLLMRYLTVIYSNCIV
jgi:hypothetical protein